MLKKMTVIIKKITITYLPQNIFVDSPFPLTFLLFMATA